MHSAWPIQSNRALTIDIRYRRRTFSQQAGFTDAGLPEQTAYLFATLSFFGGIALGQLVDACVHMLDGDGRSTHQHRRQQETIARPESNKGPCDLELSSNVAETKGSGEARGGAKALEKEQNRELREPIHVHPDGDKKPDLEAGGAEEEEENKQLVKMGLVTALAIGIHNFPEVRAPCACASAHTPVHGAC